MEYLLKPLVVGDEVSVVALDAQSLGRLGVRALGRKCGRRAFLGQLASHLGELWTKVRMRLRSICHIKIRNIMEQFFKAR